MTLFVLLLVGLLGSPLVLGLDSCSWKCMQAPPGSGQQAAYLHISTIVQVELYSRENIDSLEGFYSAVYGASDIYSRCLILISLVCTVGEQRTFILHDCISFTTWLIKMTPIIASVRNSGGMARSLTGPGACSRPRALSSGTTRPCLDSSPYCIRYKFVHSVKHRKDIKDATCRRLHSEATGGHHSLVQRCRRPRPALRRHIHERQHRHWVCVPLVTNDVRVIY